MTSFLPGKTKNAILDRLVCREKKIFQAEAKSLFLVRGPTLYTSCRGRHELDRDKPKQVLTFFVVRQRDYDTSVGEDDIGLCGPLSAFLVQNLATTPLIGNLVQCLT